MKRLIAVLILILCVFVAFVGKKEELSIENTKVAIYVGVDGVCYSIAGEKCLKFEEYADREEAVKLLYVQMRNLLSGLTKAVFFLDRDRTTDRDKTVMIFDLPPQTFTIRIESPERFKEKMFWYRKNYGIPEAYLNIFKPLLKVTKSNVLKNIISMHTKLNDQ